ncbi:SDR family NAD(P)-dependent oxidoreductase [Sphingobium sp. HBC34]|uniref:SDR family NAD(P)-dependent oxidoreductase n=1 Tax=Sphingobium cyanobacteriorum TaxID=3063954 RepID=A0ABT8ZLY0_9SPHN|nr:SDR family NAD(P)-dependent oxidoreductase [Sphingobium sp. HBC34]MDO7835560.1 SDR family NAD(P)-dependent oxidoreductase [Sphingobium sp. HBC34]
MTLRPRPEKRDPLQRKVERHVPAGLRSRAMHAMSARAAQGRFVLQQCVECSAVTYPPRDICPVCWGELAWRDQVQGATLLAETTVRVTTDLYFRAHMPWRMGTIALDAGPVALAHLSRNLTVGGRADVRLMIDKGGNAALFAMAAGEEPDMSDKQWREFVVPVRDRTILVTDGRGAVGQAVVAALQAAGAASVVVGLPAPAQPPAALAGLTGVRIVPLDLTDTRSVSECLTDIAGPLDIVVNTARFVRRGDGLIDQKHALDVTVLGLLRLTQGCAPMLQGRPSGAFVDIVSSAALAPDAGFPAFSAAQAAHLSLLQSFRHQMRGSGVRVMTLFTGPVDDEDHQSVPMPKVAPSRIAKGVVDALEGGREQLCVGDAAVDAMARWSDDPALYIREKNL